MTKSEIFKIKQAENEIINICRKNGIDGIGLGRIGIKLSNIEAKERDKIFQSRGVDYGLLLS